MNKLSTLLLLLLLSFNAISQCDFYSDYSSNAGWTQVGTLVEITGGKLEFINGAPDGSVSSSAVGTQRRVHHSLGATFNSTDTWIAEFEFTPTAVGSHSNGQPHTGHNLLALTAGTQEPFNDCADLPCTGFPTGTQDGIMLIYATDNPPNGNVYFSVRAREAGSETGSTTVAGNTLGITYYPRLERTSATTVVMSIFTDAARTTHLAGSPVSFTIPAGITGLNTVQHGNIVRGQVERELSGTIDELCINNTTNVVPPDCDVYHDYATDAGWTQVGTLVEITGGKVEFINGAPDGSVSSSAVGTQRRVHHSLGATFNSTDTWIAEFEFTPTAVGSHSNGQPHTGHNLLGLTAGTQEPFNDCADLPCTGFPVGTQDGIMLIYATDNPPNGNVYFSVRAREAGSETGSTTVAGNTLGITYYPRLERTGATTVIMSIFTDAARTTHLAGSPVSFTIPSGITGLNTIQHGNIVRGQVERELSGTIDELCINNTTESSVTETAMDKMLVYPNPIDDYVTIENTSGYPANLRILDVAGKLIISFELDVNAAKEINTQLFSSGTYILEMEQHSTLSSRKLIKL